MKKSAKRRRTVRVPRPVLAMAAPISEHPVVSIERLKDGTLNWSIRVPGASLRKARERALVEAKQLQADLDAWQAERDQARLTAKLANGIKRDTTDAAQIVAAIEQSKTLHEISRGFKP